MPGPDRVAKILRARGSLAKPAPDCYGPAVNRP